jgi:hypothetical protein
LLRWKSKLNSQQSTIRNPQSAIRNPQSQVWPFVLESPSIRKK